MPTYDPARDGCPFAWVLAAAAAERARRQAWLEAWQRAQRLSNSASVARLQRAEHTGARHR